MNTNTNSNSDSNSESRSLTSYLLEISLKRNIVNHFKIKLDFEVDYGDLVMIIPEKMIIDNKPESLLKYNWVFVSEFADQIFILNKDSTRINS